MAKRKKKQNEDVLYINRFHLKIACDNAGIKISDLQDAESAYYVGISKISNYYEDNKKHTSGLTSDTLHQIATKLSTTSDFLQGNIDYPYNDYAGYLGARHEQYREEQRKTPEYKIESHICEIINNLGYDICKNERNEYSISNKEKKAMLTNKEYKYIVNAFVNNITGMLDGYFELKDDSEIIRATIIPTSELIRGRK